MVGQFAEFPHRVIQQPCSRFGTPFHSRRRLQEVWTTDRADEHEIASEDAHRNIRSAPFVGEHEGDVLRCVPRRVEDFQLHLADSDDIAVLDELRTVHVSELILPVGGTFVGKVQLRAHPVGEFAGP